jgi:uncharacterized protein YebE (UPF0316 family)
LAIGMLVIRIITVKEASELVTQLRSAGYGVTSLDAEGMTGRAKLIFMIIKRKDLNNVVKIVTRCNPKAFISVDEIRSASEGIFPPESAGKRNYLSLLRVKRK